MYPGGKFQATFRNRHIDGFFVETRNNGDKLIGNMKNGKYDGKVTFYAANGAVYNQTYNDD